jgi:AraC-like DNA-binding protein
LDSKTYNSFFGITPKFNQKKCGVLFKRELLELPLPSATDSSRKILIAQCQDLLSSRHKENSTARRARNYILVNLDKNISMQGFADAMNVSLRTLRRKLYQEDTSFRHLLDDVRETLAVELIQNTQLSLEEISYRLGYSDTANFFHAFKRWRGHAPNKLRNK